MRAKDKIRIMKSVVNETGIMELRGEPILSGSEYETQNWTKIGHALSLLIEDDMIEGYDDSDVKKYLIEMIKTRPFDKEHTLSEFQYQELDHNIKDYTSTLPSITRILERLHPQFFESQIRPDDGEFAVELNIASNRSIDESKAKFVAVSDLFGKFLTLDKQFEIKGFDNGSNWVVFEAMDGLHVDFAISVIVCAKEIISAIAERPDKILQIMARLMLESTQAKSDDEVDAEELAERTWERHISLVKKAAIEKMISKLKEQYPDKDTLLNEGKAKAHHAVDLIVPLHSQDVKFQIPEIGNRTKSINIEINGDNNVVILPTIDPLALPTPKTSDSNDIKDEDQ